MVASPAGPGTNERSTRHEDKSSRCGAGWARWASPSLAAALTAVAFAAVSVAQRRRDKGEGGSAVTRPRRPRRAAEVFQLSAEDRKAMEEFRPCMEEQGARAPPAHPPPRVRRATRPPHELAAPRPPSEEERAKLAEALEACEDKLPEGAGPSGPPCGPPPGGPKGEGTEVLGPASERTGRQLVHAERGPPARGPRTRRPCRASGYGSPYFTDVDSGRRRDTCTSESGRCW